MGHGSLRHGVLGRVDAGKSGLPTCSLTQGKTVRKNLRKFGKFICKSVHFRVLWLQNGLLHLSHLASNVLLYAACSNPGATAPYPHK